MSGRLVRFDVAAMAGTAPPPVPYLARPLLVAGHFTLMAGSPGLGKSMLALAVSASVCMGEPVAGMETRRGRVLYIDAENGEHEVHRRIAAFGLDARAADRLVYFGADGIDLVRDQELVETEMAAHRSDLVVLDSLRSLSSMDENDSRSAGAMVDAIRNLGRRHDAAIWGLHHTGKNGQDYRGSSALGAGCELGFTLRRERNDDDAGRRVLDCWKCRPAPEPDPCWIRLSAESGLVIVEQAYPFEGSGDTRRKAPVADVLTDRILALLETARRPMRLVDVCRAVGYNPKNRTVRTVLTRLEARGRVAQRAEGWALVRNDGGVAVSIPKGDDTSTPPQHNQLHLLESGEAVS